MSQDRLDNLVMLLSADWFCDHWPRIGIGVDRESRDCIRLGCRTIVRQIMGDADQYWLASFSADRMAKTRSMFDSLLEDCRVDLGTTKRFLAIIDEAASLQVKERTSWLVLSIADQLFSNGLDPVNEPDPGVKRLLISVWASTGRKHTSDDDIERVCLESNTEWDIRIRGITPDLPSAGADFLSSLEGADRFALLWAAMRTSLSSDQRRQVVDWLQKVGKSIVGEQFALPPDSEE